MKVKQSITINIGLNMTYILDFVNNYNSPKRDGITVYKTHSRIEVGLVVNGKIVFNIIEKYL